jgi:Family of unknown function (DUF6476)
MKQTSDAAIRGVASPTETKQDPRNVRVLKYVVIFLGVLLIGCFVSVFGIIGYRLANPQAREAPNHSELDMTIGANVQLGQVSLNGDRLAVHLHGVAGDELLVIDTRHGRLVSRIKLNKAAGTGRVKW